MADSGGSGFVPATDSCRSNCQPSQVAVRPNMEAYEQLKKLIEDAADDVAKANGGNKAAGTRVRKTMQEVKKVAQVVRVSILDARA